MGLRLCFACEQILPDFYSSKAAHRFRRNVTSNIKKLLQCAILLVLCLSAFLYYSARLSYLCLSDKFVRILICKDSFSRERLFRTICDTVSPAGITTLSFEYLAAVVVPLTVLLSPPLIIMSIEDLKRISIREFLSSRGITPRKENPRGGMYLSPLREERTPSFSVDYVHNL